MSIFDNHIETQMTEMFRISAAGIKLKNKMVPGPVSANEMMGWSMRDPGTIPLARGRNLPTEFLSHFCVSDDKFDCLIDGKRKWVFLRDIFDIDVRSPYELCVVAGLDGTFDSSIPMWIEDEKEEKEKVPASVQQGIGSGKASWYHPWEDRREVQFQHPHDTNSYWQLVANQIQRNILKHVRPDVDVEIRCGCDECYWFELEHNRNIWVDIIVKSIKGQSCNWVDVSGVVLDMVHGTHRTRFMNPILKFDFTIEKEHEKTPMEEYNEADIKFSQYFTTFRP